MTRKPSKRSPQAKPHRFGSFINPKNAKVAGFETFLQTVENAEPMINPRWPTFIGTRVKSDNLTFVSRACYLILRIAKPAHNDVTKHAASDATTNDPLARKEQPTAPQPVTKMRASFMSFDI